MQGASQGVTAAASRPRFSSSDGEGSEDDLTSNGEIASSDLGKNFRENFWDNFWEHIWDNFGELDSILWMGKVLRTTSLKGGFIQKGWMRCHFSK